MCGNQSLHKKDFDTSSGKMTTIELTVQELPHVLVDVFGAVLLHPVTTIGNVPAATHEAKLELLSRMLND